MLVFSRPLQAPPASARGAGAGLGQAGLGCASGGFSPCAGIKDSADLSPQLSHVAAESVGECSSATTPVDPELTVF